MPATAEWFVLTVVLAFLVAWAITADGLMVLLLLAAVVRAFGGDAPADRDKGTLYRFVAITIALALVFSAATALVDHGQA